MGGDERALCAELDSMAREEGVVAHVCAARVDGTPLVALRADEPVYAASTIKVPIMVEVFRQAELGRLRLSDEVELQREDQVPGSGVLQHLSTGLRLSLRDLVTLMIIVSDNTATNMVLDRVGADEVTATMTSLGLAHTRIFHHLQQVPVERRGEMVTSAADLTALLVRIGQGRAVSLDASRRMVDILSRQTLSGGLSARLPIDPLEATVGAPAAVRVASKSGSLAGFRHDVGLVLMPSGSYALSVLLTGVGENAAARDLVGRISRRVFDAAARPAG